MLEHLIVKLKVWNLRRQANALLRQNRREVKKHGPGVVFSAIIAGGKYHRRQELMFKLIDEADKIEREYENGKKA